MEAVVGEDVAAPVDELARGEVAVLGQHIVEVDLRPAAARVVRQHHPDGPLATLHQERIRAGGGRVVGEGPPRELRKRIGSAVVALEFADEHAAVRAWRADILADALARTPR